MLKKEEVYVRVSSEKKARKLKDILDMFDQNVYSLRFKYCAMGDLYKDEWHSGDTPPDNKTKVSLKELRNILAKEYLKEGDVVILEDGGEKSLCEFERISGVFEGQYRSHRFCELDGTGLESYGGVHENFIRYATEEEKQMLKHEDSVINKAISLLQHGLDLDYSHEVIQGLEKLKGK